MEKKIEIVKLLKEKIIRINNNLYKISDKLPEMGDIVLDTKDMCYGVIDMIIRDKCAVKDGYSTEVAVPLNRLITLEII